MRLLFIIAIIGVFWLLYKLYLKQLLAQGRQGKIKLAVIVVGILFVILAIAGRAPYFFALIGAAMTQIMRIVPLLIRFFPMIQQMLNRSSVFQNGGGGTSKVRTRSLVMSLDHDTGDMDGDIVESGFNGRKLSSLSAAELKQYYQWCQAHDGDAIRLLQAYLARVQPDGWQQQGPNDNSQSSAVGTPATSVEEAWEVLGLESGATRDQVIEAHRRLMTRMHPDKGGSNYLAAKINAAKKVLLEHLA